MRVLVAWGPGEEALADRVVAASEGSAERAFPTSLLDYVEVARASRLVVGADTGPLHLACAVGTPVVGLYGPTDPARNGPYGTRSIVLRNPTSPTSHTRRAQPDEAMLEISVESVVEAARRLLGSTEATYG